MFYNNIFLHIIMRNNPCWNQIKIEKDSPFHLAKLINIKYDLSATYIYLTLLQHLNHNCFGRPVFTSQRGWIKREKEFFTVQISLHVKFFWKEFNFFEKKSEKSHCIFFFSFAQQRKSTLCIVTCTDIKFAQIFCLCAS